MRVTVLCVGKLKEDWQKAGCHEYLKRLTRYGKFEVREVPDCPEPAKPSPALDNQVIREEGRAILRQLHPDDYVIALAIDAEAPDSLTLARKLAAWSMDGRPVVLVIGGSLGLSEEVLARADARLSFSRLTFPHPLMRVILLEQLYRACKILAGERYHK
ncbi:MAG: 23S rRNA (pseudouridine(1915)-N(3))-methyltransferase RlmH [Clostridia bacterium]